MQNLPATDQMPQSEPNAPPRPRYGPLSLLGILTLCYLLTDLLTVSLIERSDSIPFVAIIVGIILSQYGLLATWAVLGPGPWYVRQPVAMFGALLSLGAVAAGAGAGAGVEREFVRIALSLPLIVLCFEAPLWCFRLVWGWRIVPISDPSVNTIVNARRFSLGQLFAATTMIATALALARAGQDVQEVLPVAIGAAVLGLLAVAPCVWSALGARSAAVGTFLALAYAVGGVIALMSVVASFAGTPDGNAFISLEAFSVSMIGTMHGILLVFRASGFILRRGPSRQTTSIEPMTKR